MNIKPQHRIKMHILCALIHKNNSSLVAVVTSVKIFLLLVINEKEAKAISHFLHHTGISA